MDEPTRRDFAKSLAALACVPYAKQLSEDERVTVEKNLTSASASLERLRAFPLTNADEPDFVWRAEATPPLSNSRASHRARESESGGECLRTPKAS